MSCVDLVSGRQCSSDWCGAYRLISTIETEILAARNVVDILLGEHFNSSICGAREGEGSISNTTKSEDFVYGWDC